MFALSCILPPIFCHNFPKQMCKTSFVKIEKFGKLSLANVLHGI